MYSRANPFISCHICNDRVRESEISFDPTTGALTVLARCHGERSIETFDMVDSTRVVMFTTSLVRLNKGLRISRKKHNKIAKKARGYKRHGWHL